MVPGFEGIYQIKYLRRIKVVDRYYMTYDDYGHINPDPKVAALDATRLDRNRSSPSRPADSSCPAPASTTSAAWPGPVRARFARWRSPPTAAGAGTTPSFGRRRIEWRTPGSASPGSGTEKSACSCRAAPTNWARFNRREPRPPNTGTSRWTRLPGPWRRQHRSTVEGGERWERAQWARVSSSCAVMILGMCQIGSAQSPTFGVGRTPDRGRNPCLGYLDQSGRERSSRRDTAPPRKVRRSTSRRGARAATGERGQEPRRRR